jgi:hypothetical protein
MRGPFAAEVDDSQRRESVPGRKAPLGTAQQIRLAFLWFAMFAQWLTVLPVILPDQVATIVGRDSATKEGMVGTIAAAGAVVALLVAPLAGALSDRVRARRGRRRPFLIVGALGSIVSLMLLVPFSNGGSIALYVVVILNLQFWWNVVSGGYAGLVPDVVAPEEQGTASAWLNVMTIAGTIAGNVVVVLTYSTGHAALTIAIFALATLVCLWLTLSVREAPSPGAAEPFRLLPFVRSFYIDPKAHPNFYWVLTTRLLSNMGVWSVLPFLLSYLRDVIGVDNPEHVFDAARPRRCPGHSCESDQCQAGRAAWARRGRQGNELGHGGDGRGRYVLVVLRPSLLLVTPLVLVYAAAYGAYQAVDWALALRVLPSRDAAGKDMGVWHISRCCRRS